MSSEPAAGLPRPPAARSLVAATLAALAVAALVLVLAVLPAEYGIDPTGAGRAIGLTQLFEAGKDGPAAPHRVVAREGGPLQPQPAAWREDTREFTLAPKASLEFKYTLNKGATLVYAWQASGRVEFDFHTEPDGKPASESDSFEKGEALQGNGGYTAPYDGFHGWYWQNKGNAPVTITLTSAGFYSEGILYLPRQKPKAIEIPERRR